MSYEPSHRRPPRQARWPQATPQEGWPAYVPGDGYRDGDQIPELGGADLQGRAAAGDRAQPGYQHTASRSQDYDYHGYQQAWDGIGYEGAASGYGAPGGRNSGHDAGWNGHGGAAFGYGDPPDGRAGLAEVQDAFPGSAGHLGQLDRDSYAGPRPPGPLLVAPDTIGEPGWLRDASGGAGRDRSELLIGAVTGFLAAAVAISFATLAAAFVRPQASPVIAVGGAFIDRTPAALKNFAVAHFGENDKTVLLLGMYVMIALIAIAIGCLARRNVTIGVAGIAASGLLAAFVAITRPESRTTDVIPSIIGGVAGVAALLWLARASAPVAPVRPARRFRRKAR